MKWWVPPIDASSHAKFMSATAIHYWHAKFMSIRLWLHCKPWSNCLRITMVPRQNILVFHLFLIICITRSFFFVTCIFQLAFQAWISWSYASMSIKLKSHACGLLWDHLVPWVSSSFQGASLSTVWLPWPQGWYQRSNFTMWPRDKCYIWDTQDFRGRK